MKNSRHRQSGNRLVKIAGIPLLSFFILPFSLFVSTSAAQAVEVDGVAARVGSESVLRSDVVSEMRRNGAQDESAYAETLNWLIERKLILKAAAESKMTMQEWVVENRVREIIHRSFGGDRNKLVETLAAQKVSYPEWYAKTKEDLIVGAMRWNVVDKNTVASPAAMRGEYESHRDRYVKDHSVSVSVVMLSPEEAGKRDELSASLKTKGFDALDARKYVDVKPDELFKPELVKEIEALQKGAVSRWIEIDGWSFLLRKDGETAGKELSFDEAYDAIEANVKEQEAKRLYKAWIDRLRAETYVKVF